MIEKTHPYFHELDLANMTDEEIAAWEKTDELWWKENRVKMAVYTVVGLFFFPLYLLIDWIGRRMEAKKEKAS